MRRWIEPEIRDDVAATVEVSARGAEWPLGRVLDLAGVHPDRYFRSCRGIEKMASA